MKEIFSRIKYFECEREKFVFQLIVAFSVSVVFAPLSFGIVALVVTAVLWEFVLAGYYKLNISLFPRIAVILASVLGFIIGRWIYGDDDPFHQAKNFNIGKELKGVTSFHKKKED